MADTAAHLVDRVFPRVPVRQWLLSLPYALRYRLAYDASLVTDVLAIFTRTVFASLIRRAREFGAERKPQCGAVSFIQRFDSALRLNLHIHMLAFDGVYATDDNDRPQFQVLLAPDDDEIARLTESLAQRITKLLDRRSLGPDSDPEESDSLRRDEPWLAGLYAAAVSGRTANGPNAGRRVTRVGDQIDPESMDFTRSPRCASVDGFSLHANVAVHAEDRPRLAHRSRDLVGMAGIIRGRN
jgi:Putative transposase